MSRIPLALFLATHLHLLATPAIAQISPALFAYDPNPAYPFGRANPDAPAELTQFDFMIGEFDCVDHIRGRNGKWNRTVAIWNASYFLNGYGIQDEYWSDSFATSNIRIFDPVRKRWFVNFFSMPSNQVSAGQWSGREEQTEEGRNMVMWTGSPDRKNGSRLTFYNITDDGFDWISEGMKDGVATAGWKSSCKRRKRGQKLATPKFVGFDPNPAQPFGARNPKAPLALDQLAFQIGAFTSEVGNNASAPHGLASGRIFLNGWGIQTKSYERDHFASSFYLFDLTKKAWRIVSFRMPTYECIVWDQLTNATGYVFVEALRNGLKVQSPTRLTLQAMKDGDYTIQRESNEANADRSVEIRKRSRR